MFSARRKPKRIARDESERGDNEHDEELENGPVVHRPNVAPKSKSKSKLRTSFVPDEAEDSSDTPVIVKPKSRLGRNVSTQSLPRFSVDSRNQEENTLRPSYSKSALEELRNSTPSTPKDLSVYDPSSSGAEDGIRSLDIASKFGAQATSSLDSAIPTTAEIAEKKARRARLAKEQAAADFIPLDDADNDQLYDSDGEFKPRRMQVSTYLDRRQNDAADDDETKNTRLIRDDEDVMEGFELFTEDAESSRITMNRHQLLRAQRQDREALRSLIDHAESNSESESDSEAERNHAYETAQTAHGMDGVLLGTSQKVKRQRPRPPREVHPIPKLAVALGRLRDRIAAVELERVKLERRREAIRQERADVLASQAHIQRSLTEAGEELDRVLLRQRQEQMEQEQEQEQSQKEKVEVVGNGSGDGPDPDRDRDRGLDTIGAIPTTNSTTGLPQEEPT